MATASAAGIARPRRRPVSSRWWAPAAGRRRRPGKLHRDKGYDYAHLRRWLRCRGGIRPRIARKGIEPSNRLDRHGGVVERVQTVYTLRMKSVATGLCVDDSNIGLRHFGCQDQNGQYANYQRFVLNSY